MAVASANKNYFNFSGGFNSDVSPLNFPENTSLDEENFPLRIDGERHRRKGMDYEANYVKASQTIVSTDAVQAYDWHNVANDSTVNFQVVQTGSTLHFYSKDSTSYSNNKKSFTVDLTTRKVSGASDANVQASPIQGIQGKGIFFVTGQYIEPFYIEYSQGGDSISLTRVFIAARDFKGTEESIGVADRPTTLTTAHTYDLYNQGWTDARISSFFSSLGVYPSNVDRWEYGVYTDSSTGKEAFDPSQMDLQNLGNTPAAKGHFITTSIFDTTQSTDASALFSIDTYTYSSGTITMVTVEDHGLTTSDSIVIQNNSFTYDNGAGCGSAVTGSWDGTHTVTVTGAKTFTFTQTLTGFVGFCDQYTSKGYVLGSTVSNPNGEVISVRPEAIGFYAGRVWYGGIRAGSIGSNIYFSQIAVNNSQLGKSYQEADPTSENISELIATDGGVVAIPEMGHLLKMIPVGNSFVLFADNGVWSIEAGETGYFTATSYSLRRITDVGVVSSRSIVQAEGLVFFWSSNGVYMLQEAQTSGLLSASNISLNKIEVHLQTIPSANKDKVKGVYDSINKEVKWLYNTDSSYPNKFTKELIFNLALQGYTKHSIDSTVGPYVAEIVGTVDKSDPENKIKYVTYEPSSNSITFSNYNNTSFLDWEAFDSVGIDAPAYIITSHELLDDAMRKKFANYMYCYFNRTEKTATSDGSGGINLTPKSGCLMRARWDWADSSVSNRWSTQRQVYRFKKYFQPTVGTYDNGMPIVVTKNKVRGDGKVVSFEFQTEASKDCQILGWAVAYLGVTKP